ncbi:GNAT family N-acetyltransferase [Psychromarinibacter sp. S121]|uniref:GNAT family N-acetyltransferase n=1 Tax=Psychromarinibacter sp. S121 TaxID=3415127 RepID=UPI003C79CC51
MATALHVTAFSTDRFRVLDWRPLTDRPTDREVLEKELAAILTPKVLAHLPPSMQLAPSPDAASAWIDARKTESEVMVVTSRTAPGLVGLIILAAGDDAEGRRDVHVGYLLAEHVWGNGAATELLRGLVSMLRTGPPARLLGGVGRDNPASARVLQKAGFAADPRLSTPDSDVYTLQIG